ncbi:MAG: dihydrofolate reductase family protein [Prosthecobacter sp.]
MSKTFIDVAISLDGYIAGPNGRAGNPLGDGGLRLHEWMFKTAAFLDHISQTGGETGPDNDLVEHVFARAGAYVLGRNMFNEGEVGWPEEAPFRAPVYVLTHTPREPWVRKGGTTFYFVTDGFDSALQQAKAAAGGKDVRISGGADVIQQALKAGVVDEMTLHLAPLLLGAGVRLFDTLTDEHVRLQQVSAVASPAGTTHLSYKIVH